MFSETNHAVNIVLSILLFPMLFQKALIGFSWGAFDNLMLVIILKRLFLILPAVTFIAACWITIVSLVTVIFRQNRQPFVVALILTWWDYGKSLFTFWGGILKACIAVLYALLGILKIIIVTLWSFIKDILFLPVRLLIAAGRGVTGSSIPWIAVTLTLIAAILEAMIFTPIMAPVVMDILPQFQTQYLYVVLFFMLFMLVLASFAVLSITFSTVKKKEIGTAILIVIIELIVISVEVMFLYREFVDALVPWMAQYQENFELGPVGTIAIAFVAWVGVRSLVWFLFASHGAPVIMAVIQGKPLAVRKDEKPAENLKLFGNSAEFFTALKEDGDWIQTKGNDILNAIVLPPLQLVAATINFLILLLTSKHMFELPFQSVSDIQPSSKLNET